jgi:hypothetical protein
MAPSCNSSIKIDGASSEIIPSRALERIEHCLPQKLGRSIPSYSSSSRNNIRSSCVCGLVRLRGFATPQPLSPREVTAANHFVGEP